MAELVIITGLEREAAILRRALAQGPAEARRRVVIACGGPGAAGVRRAWAVLEGRPRLCLSVGFAAGLIPALEPGEIVVPAEITAGSERWRCLRLGEVVGQAPFVPIARLGGTAEPLAGPREKMRLHLLTGAVAADMESAALARLCADRGIAFAALRVISDAQAHWLPPAVIDAVDDQGRLAIGRLARGLLTRPADWGDFLRLARAGRRAEAALGRLGAALFEVALPGLL